MFVTSNELTGGDSNTQRQLLELFFSSTDASTSSVSLSFKKMPDHICLYKYLFIHHFFFFSNITFFFHSLTGSLLRVFFSSLHPLIVLLPRFFFFFSNNHRFFNFSSQYFNYTSVCSLCNYFLQFFFFFFILLQQSQILWIWFGKECLSITHNGFFQLALACSTLSRLRRPLASSSILLSLFCACNDARTHTFPPQKKKKKLIQIDKFFLNQ